MKKLITIFTSLLLLACISVNVKANDYKVIDTADVLTTAQEDKLQNLALEFIEKTNFDLVIYFVENANQDVTSLADDAFDYNDYGLGTNKDGLILCVDVGKRDYTITTHGASCIDTYTDKALERIYEYVTVCFSNNAWSDGAEEFINQATYVYNNYDEYHYQRSPLDALVPSLIVAGVAAIIGYLILISQLKKTKVGVVANQYMNDTKIDLLRSGEVYLYTTVSRTKIERNNNDSSSTHVSSSGETHGGGGSHKF